MTLSHIDHYLMVFFTIFVLRKALSNIGQITKILPNMVEFYVANIKCLESQVSCIFVRWQHCGTFCVIGNQGNVLLQLHCSYINIIFMFDHGILDEYSRLSFPPPICLAFRNKLKEK